jgi:putative heme iron utilization protein
MTETSPIRPTDDEARTLGRRLLNEACFAALGVLNPATGHPDVTRGALSTDAAGAPLTLVSDLSAHTKALRANPVASLLVGEPGEKGDPLTHPRLSLSCTANFIEHSDPEYAVLRGGYLQRNPKAKLYIDFADFAFLRFTILSAALNGGFGKAFHLTAQDLQPPLAPSE